MNNPSRKPGAASVLRPIPGRHWYERLSIQAKLNMAVFLAVFLILLLQTLIVSYVDQQALQKMMREQGQSISASLTQNFARIFLLDSNEVVTDTASALAEFPHVQDVYLYNTDELPVFQYHHPQSKLASAPEIFAQQSFRVDEQGIHIFLPVEYQGRFLGTVYLRMTTALIDQWRERQHLMLLGMILMLVLISVLLSFSLQRIFTRPLSLLASAMKTVSKTKDYSLRVETDAKDEIGEVFAGFNHMLSQVESYTADLRTQKMAMDAAAIVSITDSVGNIVYVNEKFSRISGFKREELLGENLRIIKSAEHDRPFFRKLWKTIVDGDIWHGEIKNRKKNNENYWVDCTIIPLHAHSGHSEQYLSIQFDITSQKMAEEKLLNLNEELENRVMERTRELNVSNQRLMQSEKMAALGELVAGVAHEINTPVGVGVTASSHLHDEVEHLAKLLAENKMTRSNLNAFIEEALTSTRIILTNLERAAQLVSSFKQVAADQSNQEKRFFNVAFYLDEIMMSLHPKLKKTRLKVDIDCDKSLEINSYPGVFYQIITNLVTNSLLHAFEPGQEGVLSISISVAGGRFQMVYQDTGKGMTAEQVNRVFDPFYTTARSEGGTGLGMHIVYNLVTQVLGGHISCDNRLSCGVRFVIDFPVESAAQSDPGT